VNHEQQWFPGLEPRKPGRITVTRAEPMTIEEKEGMKDDKEKIDPSFHKSKRDIGLLSTAKAPAPQAPPEPVHAPASESSGRNEEERKGATSERNTDKNAGNRMGSFAEETRNLGEKRYNYSKIILRVSSSILAALSALMSWYYSFEWFRDKLPGAWRFFLPIVIVGCSVMLPQVSLAFLNRKGIRFKGAALAVFLGGLLASGLSMLSTIAGIYNANSDAINRKSSALISSQSDEDARQEVRRIDAELSRINAEIDATQAKVDTISVSDTLKGDSQALMRRLNNAKRSKQDYEAQRAKASAVIEAARATGNTAETVREDFNAFLGRQLRMDPGRVEFGMAAAPALLLDVVAPILSAVALFL
jgi:Skp family chaperone for outer membrane proteins